jgi:hypothetical protein
MEKGEEQPQVKICNSGDGGSTTLLLLLPYDEAQFDTSSSRTEFERRLIEVIRQDTLNCCSASQKGLVYLIYAYKVLSRCDS